MSERNNKSRGYGTKKSYYYAVQAGRRPGVYNSWEECQANTSGYQNAVFKKFSTQEEAAAFSGTSPNNHSVSSTTHHYSPEPVSRHYSPEPASRHHSPELTSYYKPTTYNTTSYLNPTRITPKIEKRKHSSDNDDRVHKQARFESSAHTYAKKTYSVVYTDGASSNNGKANARAGYGVYWGDNDPRNASVRLDGIKQTNQRAEASAVNHALEQSINDKEPLEIMTDSQYVINAATVWSKKWVEKGWKSTAGGEVQNRDLFEKMLNLIDSRQGEVKFTYVPGHKGVPGNEKADQLAVAGAQKN